MTHFLIHHKVSDFAKWKTSYDQHKPARTEAGLTELHLLRGASDPNDVVILFRASDPAKARAFTQSPDLKSAMERAGVVGIPELVELE